MIIFMIMGLFSPGIVYWIEATGEYMLISSLVPLVFGVAGLRISIYLKRSARKNKQGVRSLSNHGAGA